MEASSAERKGVASSLGFLVETLKEFGNQLPTSTDSFERALRNGIATVGRKAGPVIDVGVSLVGGAGIDDALIKAGVKLVAVKPVQAALYPLPAEYKVVGLTLYSEAIDAGVDAVYTHPMRQLRDTITAGTNPTLNAIGDRLYESGELIRSGYDDVRAFFGAGEEFELSEGFYARQDAAGTNELFFLNARNELLDLSKTIGDTASDYAAKLQRQLDGSIEIEVQTGEDSFAIASVNGNNEVSSLHLDSRGDAAGQQQEISDWASGILSTPTAIEGVVRITSTNPQTGESNAATFFRDLESDDVANQLGLDLEIEYRGPAPGELLNENGRKGLLVSDSTEILSGGREWSLGSLLDDGQNAVKSLGRFITEQTSQIQTSLLSNEVLTQSTGQFFAAFGRDLLAGELDADEAIIEFAKLHVRNATGRVLSDAIGRSEAISALEDVFKEEVLGVKLHNARAFAESFGTAFSQMALTFAIDSSGWDTKDYVHAGISVLSSNVTSYVTVHEVGGILANGRGNGLSAAGAGVVAAATNLVGGLLEGQKAGQIALGTGVGGATAFASSLIAEAFAPAVAEALVGTAAGELIGLSTNTLPWAVAANTTLVSNLIVPVIGLAVGYVVGEFVGEIVGGKEYDPHEFETLQQLRDSEYVVTEENGERIVVATNPDGTTIKLFEEDARVAIGGIGSDTLVGDSLVNHLFGSDGNDFLDGLAGDDELIAGHGEDHVEGGAGDDFVQAGEGNDIVYGGEGQDYVDGNEGNDLIHGEDGDDAIIGGNGADVIYGGDGDDEIIADIFLTRLEDGTFDPELLALVSDYTVGSGTRDDFVDAGAGNDYVRGGEGNDTIIGGEGNDVLDGESEDDNIFGGTGDDQIFGGSGSDFVHGEDGVDIIQGDFGDDFLLGGAGIDFITGGVGHDVVDGGDDDDTLIGEVGDDILIGGSGDDDLNGGFGRDILMAGAGTDLLQGEEGNDLYLFFDDNGLNRIDDSEGRNDVYLMDAGSDELSLSVFENDLIVTTTANGLTEIHLTNFWVERSIDTLHFSDGKQLKLDQLVYPTEGLGVDFRISAEASDSVTNVEQELQNVISVLDDRMSANASNPHSDWYNNNYQTSDYVIPEANSFYSSVQAVTYKKARGKYGGHYNVVAKSYEDTLIDVDDRVVGAWWSENIIGTGAAELFYGNDGKDILEPGGGNDLVFGGAGDDEIYGGDGHDYLVGGSGNDVPIRGQAGNDTIFGVDDDDLLIGDDVGQAYDDLIYGGAGDDEILGRGGADLLYGDDGDDEIRGGEGKDVIVGGQGNDVLIGDLTFEENSYQHVNGDSDIIFGNDGDDIIYAEIRDDWRMGFVSDETVENYLHGGAGNDEIHGAYGNDVIYGGSGIDYISASRGDDWAHGGPGNDVISGDNGNDIIFGGDEDPADVSLPNYYGANRIQNDFLFGGLGSDYIYGGAGNDYIGGDEELAYNELVNYGIHAGGNDYLYGGRGNDVIDGHGGNDFIIAGEGDDAVFGGQGSDEIYGSAGNDQVFGQTGDDIVSGGDGLDHIVGGEGIDTVSFLDQITRFGISAFIFDDTGFGAGHVAVDVNHANLSRTLGEGTWEDTFWSVENLIGSHGDDRLWGNALANAIYGEGGDDLLHGAEGADVLDGGEGTDMASYAQASEGVVATLGIGFTESERFRNDFDVYISIENLLGSAYDDQLGGNDGPNKIYGGEGDDFIKGADGDDQLFGEVGNDIVEGGGGDDTLFGWEGFDQLYGGPGADVLAGEQGGDWLFGNEGDDHLIGDTTDSVGDDFVYGGPGNDLLEGGAGNDYLEGNEDDDRIFGWTGDDIINGGQGNDQLFGDDGNDQIQGGSGDDTAFGGAGQDSLWGGEGIDILNGDAGDDTVSGDDGDDQLYGGAGNDRVYGGKGDDFLLGDDGDDILSGEDGDDNIFGYTGDDSIFGGRGNDSLAGEDGHDTISGDEGDDIIYGDGPGATGNDRLYGGPGNDLIRGNAGDDVITGDDGVDALYGDEGDDEVYAGNDDDFVNGGAGNDILNGGSGNDNLLGYQGDDLLVGESGDDQLFGHSGMDTIRGGDGEDTIYGDDGTDMLFGDADNDWLSGWHSDDLLDGGDGDDVLLGENGNDRLVGGAGNDILIGDHSAEQSVSAFSEGEVMDSVEARIGFRNYGLVYQGEDATLPSLRDAPHDMLIISPGKFSITDVPNSEVLWTPSEVAEVKSNGKLAYGYLNVSKINTFNLHWDEVWLDSSGTPHQDSPWLQAKDSAFENTWLVNFWEPQWQDILENRLSRLIEQGFDGVFLDDVLEYFSRRGSVTDDIYQAAREMRDLIVNLHSFAEQKISEINQVTGSDRDPNAFRFIANGAPYLISDANNGTSEGYSSQDLAYFDSVDAVLAENYVSLSAVNSSYQTFIDFLKSEFLSRDVVVLSLDGDQVTEQQRIETMKSAIGHGFLPFATENQSYDTLSAPLTVGFGEVIEPGNDHLEGGLGSDMLIGGAGDDTLQLSVDELWGSGFVAWNVGTPSAPINGERVAISPRTRSYDVFDGSSGSDKVVLTGDGDSLFLDDEYSPFPEGNQMARVIDIELIEALGGDDIVDLTSRKYSHGDVRIEGGEGNDVLWASSGNDVLIGGNGNDHLDGADGDDRLEGGSGDDVLLGRLGTNVVIGGDGADQFRITEFDALSKVIDFSPDDGDILELNLAEFGAELSNIARYLRAEQVAGDTNILADTSGSGQTFKKVVELKGVVGVEVHSYLADGFFSIG